MARNEMLDTLLGLDEERRAEVLSLMAGSDKVKLEALIKDVEGKKKQREESAKKEAEKKAREQRKKAIDAVNLSLSEFSGDFSTLESAFASASELEVSIVLSGFSDGVPTFSIPAPAKQKRSKGRPSKDTPSDYLNADGKRVLGAITDWARENLPADVLSEYLKEVGDDFDFEKKKVPFKKAGDNLAKQLVADGYLTFSEFVEEDVESENEEDSSD